MRFILITAIFILLKLASFAQACDDCSNPRVVIYDCIVDVPRPVDVSDSIIAWQTLFWPSAAACGYIRANDPQENCITNSLNLN